MSHDNSEGYAVVGFFFGLYMFYKGFGQFRSYLLIADTPEIAIRSIPMGFAQIHGKAEGEKTIQSPISHTPCFVYKVVIQRWHARSGDDDDGYWVPHCTDLDGVGFHLTDESGKVLVDAQGAEFDVPETASCEAGKGTNPQTGVAATQQELLEYVTRAESRWAGNMFEHGLRYAGQHFGSAQEQQRENLRDVFQHPPGSPESLEGVRRAEEMARKPGATPKFNALTKALAVNPPATSGQPGAASGRYSFTEYCLVPGVPYNISGTCMENPHPQDADDHNMMARGSTEQEFVISNKAEKPLETGMRKTAVHKILVGAGLAIACLAILLFDLGLLF
jgi:hypothetical protein